MTSTNLPFASPPHPTLCLIIPCFNEQEVLPLTARMFLEQIQAMVDRGKVSTESRVLFVDDGSSDDTWKIIQALAEEDARVRGIRLSRNRGHQNALLAGLMEAKDLCDITISMDCDGQDDILAAERMVDAYLDGAEVVYGIRISRRRDSAFKRGSARLFYRMMRGLGTDTIPDHADYRLVSSLVLQQFANFREVNLFLRGMFPLVGFPSATVYYDRRERMAGKSHYPLGRMLALAFDGLTSLSIRPIRIISVLGFLLGLGGFAGIVWAVVMHVLGRTVSGWSSLVCIHCLIGGLQMVSLGVIGEYIGKTYLETKQRPRYIVSERTWEERKRPWEERNSSDGSTGHCRKPS